MHDSDSIPVDARTGVRGIPEHLYIEVAAACDMDCPMCVTMDHRFGRRKLLSTEDICSGLIEPAARAGVKLLVISGGEPTLRKDLPRILDAGIANGMKVWLASNMLNIRELRLRGLVDQLRGNGSIAVSFDSHIAAEMNAMRGGNVFDKVVANSRRLVAMASDASPRLRTAAVIIVQPENIHSVMTTVDYLLEDIGFPMVAVYMRHDYHYVTVDNAASQTRADWVRENRRELIALGLRLFARAGRDRRVNTRGTLHDWVNFIEDPQRIERKCQASNHMFFNSEGKLRSCMFGTDVGDVRRDSFETLLHGEATAARHRLTDTCRICLLSCN
ncbi:MAG: radical SAM protein [Pseudomonadota bacterium]|nr:radical SAM protein [Pseudomonadota bacterium]